MAARRAPQSVRVRIAVLKALCMNPRVWRLLGGTESTLKLLLAHLERAEAVNALSYTAGIRQLGAASGLGDNAVLANNRKLIGLGFLVRTRKATGTVANRYEVSEARLRTRFKTTPASTPIVAFRVPESVVAFMHGDGLSLFLWTCLDEEEGRTVEDLATLTGSNPRWVRAKLKRAAQYGLAMESSDGEWIAGHSKLFKVASKTGARRRARKRQTRRRQQQEQYRQGLAHHSLSQPVYRSLEWSRPKSVVEVAAIARTTPEQAFGQLDALVHAGAVLVSPEGLYVPSTPEPLARLPT